MLRELDPLAFKLAAVITSGASAAASAVSDSWPLQLFGVPLSVLLACFAGATIALAFLPPMPRVKMFIAVMAGTMIAAYLTPLMLHWLEWSKWPQLHGGMGFALGLLGYWGITWVFVKGPEILTSRLKGGGS
jgi:hypothetical protein